MRRRTPSASLRRSQPATTVSAIVLLAIAIARYSIRGRGRRAVGTVFVLAAIVRAFANGQIEWSYVSRFLTVKVILEGIEQSHRRRPHRRR